MPSARLVSERRFARVWSGTLRSGQRAVANASVRQWGLRQRSGDARTGVLAREVLVHREFVNFGLHSGSSNGGQRRSDAFCSEAVEVRTRLPEVEHAPTTFYWTGRVKDESIRWICVRVDHGL